MATKKQQEMESMKKEEELDFLSTKRLDFLALREEKRIEDIKKRESLANRTKLAQEQKKIVEDLLSKKKEEENSLLECRHLNWKDDQEFVKQQEMRKRESLAFRLDEWRKHKQADESAEREEMQQREEAMQTRYEEWKDIQNYKQELTKNARESLCWRLNKWRNERSHEQQQELERLEALEIERELQRQELEDIKAYKQSLKEARKQSLAFRLNEARKVKKRNI